MHMADALLSPAVGGTMWGVTAVAVGACSRRLRAELGDRRAPLMGVLGAFVFAVQMINFAIPGTGSSGHLGGALLLAILLGPCAAFLTIVSVLVVQALFFADGGLLALGCNIFNLGFLPVFVAYPLVYLPLAGGGARRRLAASLAASVAGLQLGALSVVLQTVLSGISSLPFAPFLGMMLPIHLGIGIVEGFVTAAVAGFIARYHPEILVEGAGGAAGRRAACLLLVAAALLGGGLSPFADEAPDGLEWAISRVAGEKGPQSPPQGVHALAGNVQRRTAILPDYGFSARGGNAPEKDRGTAVAGLVGGFFTLLLAAGAGAALKRRSRRS